MTPCFDIFIDNKYLRLYKTIISNASSRDAIVGYTEKHHIIPKSFGGDNSKDNLVTLTAREHFLCHRLLTKITTGDYRRKMLSALCFLSGRHKHAGVKWSSRQYAIAKVYRSEFNRMSTPWNKGIKTGQVAWNTGLIGWMSEEQKVKQRAAVRSYKDNTPDWYIKSFGNPEVREASEQLRLKAVSKRTVVYGVIYDSASQAAIDLGMKKTTLIKRILSKNYPDYMYVGENK